MHLELSLFLFFWPVAFAKAECDAQSVVRSVKQPTASPLGCSRPQSVQIEVARLLLLPSFPVDEQGY